MLSTGTRVVVALEGWDRPLSGQLEANYDGTNDRIILSTSQGMIVIPGARVLFVRQDRHIEREA